MVALGGEVRSGVWRVEGAGQRFWGRGASTGRGALADAIWGKGEKARRWGRSLLPDVVSGEGETARRAVVPGWESACGGAVVGVRGRGRGQRDLGARVLCLGQLTGGPSSYSGARDWAS
jgi:hypothetical protein